MVLTHELVFDVTKDMRVASDYGNYSGVRDKILDLIENTFRLMNNAKYIPHNGRNYTNSRRSDAVVESVASQLPDIIIFPCQVKINVTFDTATHGKIINTSINITTDPISI